MSDLVELTGLGCITVAAWTVAAALGWLVLGLGLLLVAQGIDGAVSVRIVRELVVAAVARLPRRRESA